MKKGIFLILIFFFFKIFGFSQENYFVYHKNINRAFEFISNEEFENAEFVFNEVFREYDFVFPKDYVVAAQIAVLNGHDTLAISFLRKAVKGGFLLDCTQQLPVFKALRNKPSWLLFIQEEKELRKEYLKSIDLKLWQNLNKRYQEEQEAKRTTLYSEIVNNNFENIKTICANIGFPGEKIVGIDYQKLAPKISDCDIGNSKVIATMLHVVYPISTLGEVFFIEAIRKGEIHPREFAIIYNFEVNKVSVLYGSSNKKFPSLSTYHFNFPFGKLIDNTVKVNADRAKFGICNIEVDTKINAIEVKYRMKLFFGYK